TERHQYRAEPNEADQRLDANADAPRVVAERVAEGDEHVAPEPHVDSGFGRRRRPQAVDTVLRRKDRQQAAVVATHLELAHLGDIVRPVALAHGLENELITAGFERLARP